MGHPIHKHLDTDEGRLDLSRVSWREAIDPRFVIQPEDGLAAAAYLGRRFLRADPQHNAATVEQAKVESGYDEDVILLNRTR